MKHKFEDINGYPLTVGTSLVPFAHEGRSNAIVFGTSNLLISVLSDFGNVVRLTPTQFEQAYYVPEWFKEHAQFVHDSCKGIMMESVPERIDVQIALLEKAKRKFRGTDNAG